MDKILLGYDPDVWRKTDMQIRDGEQNLQEFHKLNMPSPVKGKHKFSHCQQMYEDIHDFLNDRQWAPTKSDHTMSGTTWIELFILFDTTGARSEGGTHIRDPEATSRADKRRTKPEMPRTRIRGKGNTQLLSSLPWTWN